jgi:CRP-like cAMP-binding protein
MKVVNVLSDLRSLDLFHEFTDSELASLADLADVEEFSAGQLIVRQDEPGDAMYLLLNGKAIVLHRAEGRSFELAELGRGEFFGEFALVDDGPRSADVSAKEPCVALKITQGVLRALAGVYPAAAFKLLAAVGRAMVKRARANNRKYLDTLLLCRGEEGQEG